MDFYPRSHRVEALSVDGRRMSVCPVPDSRSSMEGHSKLKTDRKKALDLGDLWPHLDVNCSMVKVTRQPNVTELSSFCHSKKRSQCLTSSLVAAVHKSSSSSGSGMNAPLLILLTRWIVKRLPLPCWTSINAANVQHVIPMKIHH